MGVFLFAGTLLVGLTSYVTDDKDREWWARSGGTVLAMALAWPVAAGDRVVRHQRADVRVRADRDRRGRRWNRAGRRRLGRQRQFVGGTARRRTAQASTPGVAGQGRRRAAGAPGLPRAAGDAAGVGEPGGGGDLRAGLSRRDSGLVVADARRRRAPSWHDDERDSRFSRRSAIPSRRLFSATEGVLWTGGRVLPCCAALASYFINVNSFSLHGMYKQRLIRAYLGASNAHRHPHPFTGFDENDNMTMCALTDAQAAARRQHRAQPGRREQAGVAAAQGGVVHVHAPAHRLAARSATGRPRSTAANTNRERERSRSAPR